MQSDKIKKITWTAISLFLLCMGFLLCRYLLFDLHGMKQIPFVLFVFGLIVICIAAIFNGKKIMISTALGYTASFFMGVLFKVDWVDSHGTAMDNLWIWFILAFVTFVFVGAVWEIVSKGDK